jgi:DNA replication and repair protein RecF
LRINRLQIENFRNLARTEIEPHERLNYFIGPNGAGKTSILESIVVLSRGRSFRTQQASELIRTKTDLLRVVAETQGAGGRIHRLGLERSNRHWRARKDGQDLGQLSLLAMHIPLVLMEPNSHQLISGQPEGRRRFLDWGVFHVEHSYLEISRRYARALKQRNAALRNRQISVLESIDELVSNLGENLSEKRALHAEKLIEAFHGLIGKLSPGLLEINIQYRKGWKGSIGDALLKSRERDLERGATGNGPHRADLMLLCNSTPARAILSRGEQKTVSAALILAQAGLLAELGDTPLILLDDLASEIDSRHFSNVLALSMALGGQTWVTGTAKQDLPAPHKMFHVEHGNTQEMV